MIIRTTSMLRLPDVFAASLLLLGVACASNSEPIGQSQQPVSNDGSESADDTACAAALTGAEAGEGECTITARGLCFSSREAACACAGCGLDECAIGESFPEQAFCPSHGGGSDPDRPVSDGPDSPVSDDGDGVSGQATDPGQPGAGSDGTTGCR